MVLMGSLLVCRLKREEDGARPNMVLMGGAYLKAYKERTEILRWP